MSKGSERERNLPKSSYFGEHYFGLQQLFSFSYQIHDIYHLKPSNILEIGVGNGFTSSFLRRSGFDVTTADINPGLEPDICCSIEELPHHVGQGNYDLIVCCEVLEHMPFDEFVGNIEVIRSIGKRLYLTLPNYNKVFGFSGLIRIPKFAQKIVQKQFEMPGDKQLPPEHYWEVGSSPTTHRKEIRRILNNFYQAVDVTNYGLNPYHLSFTCTPSNASGM